MNASQTSTVHLVRAFDGRSLEGGAASLEHEAGSLEREAGSLEREAGSLEREAGSLAREAWRKLAGGHPFRSLEWLEAWWRAYAAGGELFLLLVRDGDGDLIGVAPWRCEITAAAGRTVRFLGDGEVCTDYCTLLSSDDHRDRVACSIAEWLTRSGADGGAGRWDLLLLENVVADDPAILRLVERLRAYEAAVVERAALDCWAIPLPETWDEYLGMLSKNHRKSLRKLQRRFAGQASVRFHMAKSEEQRRRGMRVLIDLHQRRWEGCGEPGCFASRRFDAFLHDAAEALFQTGQLQLCWLEHDERPVAAQIAFLGEATVFVYQGGIDPDFDRYSPGNLLSMWTLISAIESGARSFDFLRGDESYKPHWRAVPTPCSTWRIAAPHAMAQVRNRAWLAGDAVKQAIKGGLRLTGLRAR